MKKIFFGLLAFSSISTNAQVDFTLKTSNSPSDTLYILNQTTDKSLIADKNGTFKAKLEIPDGIYQLFLGDESTKLYLKNGKDLSITVDCKKFNETLNYSGKGAKENIFLKKQTIFNKRNIQKATNENQLSEEIKKTKDSIFLSIPKELDKTFVKLFQERTAAEFAELEHFMKQLFENKKLNGTFSPSFDFENHKGGTSKLEDFKGKYVYVDVWATWCVPCRGEIPHLKKTEEAFHGKNIEFVSISIDQQKDNAEWQKFVTKKQLGGVQLRADKEWNSDFVKAYKINAIPHFILIDPEGKIVNANAPRPSSPELPKLLDSVLK